MKRKTISILGLAIGAIVAGGLCLTGNVRAQMDNQRSDTSIADNPHLRKSTTPSSSTPSAPKLSEKDRKFIRDAANAGAAEVADGKVAQQRGESAEVKRIGAHMVADHSKANKELVAVAKKKGVTIDIDQGKPRNWAKSNFDQQYLDSLENDHETDIKIFEKEARSGDDADLKSWASKTLPTLKAHLTMLKDAKRKTKSSGE